MAESESPYAIAFHAARRNPSSHPRIDLATRRSAKQLTPITTAPIPSTRSSTSAPLYPVSYDSDGPSDSVSASRKSRVKSSMLDLFKQPTVERSRGYHEDMSYQPQPSALPSESQRKLSTKNSWTREIESNIQSRPQTATRPKSGYRASTHKDVTVEAADSMSPSWEMLPLFQAYSQAVKYTILDDLSSPNDVQLQTKASIIRDEEAFAPDKGGGGIGRQMLSRMKSKTKLRSSVYSMPKMRVGSSAISNKRIFVLVTSGILLQYNGDGPADRLPEKILRLGPSSAAFASDAIAGRHWVLQVMHAANDDGSSANESPNALISRFSLPAVNSRKYVSSLLMIFADGQAMNSWMSTIRAEIEQITPKQDSFTNATLARPVKTADGPMPEPRHSRRMNRLTDETPPLQSSEVLTAGIESNPGSGTILVDSFNSKPEDSQLLAPRDNEEASIYRRPSVVGSDVTAQPESTSPHKTLQELKHQTFFYSANSSISVPTGPPEPFVNCLPGLETGAFTSFYMENSPPLKSQVPDFPLPTTNPLPSPVYSVDSWYGEGTLGKIAGDDVLDLSPTSLDGHFSLDAADALPESPVIPLPRTPETVVAEPSVNDETILEAFCLDDDLDAKGDSPALGEDDCEAVSTLELDSLDGASKTDSSELKLEQECSLEVAQLKDVQERSSLERISESDPTTQLGDETICSASPSELSTIMEQSKVLSDSDSGVQMSSFRYSTFGYYARSSGYPSTSNSGNTSRRTSTIVSSAPLPLRLSSRSSSTRNSTIRESFDFSSAMAIPPLPTSVPTPTSASASASASPNPLRRPVSIQVRANPNQPSFTTRPKAPTSTPTESRSSTTRFSTAVPIIRPPINTNKRTSVSWTTKTSPVSSPKTGVYNHPTLPT